MPALARPQAAALRCARQSPPLSSSPSPSSSSPSSAAAATAVAAASSPSPRPAREHQHQHLHQRQRQPLGPECAHLPPPESMPHSNALMRRDSTAGAHDARSYGSTYAIRGCRGSRSSRFCARMCRLATVLCAVLVLMQAAMPTLLISPHAFVSGAHAGGDSSMPPPATPSEILASADALIKNRKFSDALNALDSLIGSSKDNAPAYYKRALVFELMNRPRQAISDWREVLRLDPSNTKPHLRIAELHKSEDKKKKKIAIIQEAKKAHEDLAELIKAEKRVLESAPENKLSDFDAAAVHDDVTTLLQHAPRALDLLQRRVNLEKRRGVDAANYISALVALSRVEQKAETFAELAKVFYSAYYDDKGSQRYIRNCARLDPESSHCRSAIKFRKNYEKVIKADNPVEIERKFNKLASPKKPEDGRDEVWLNVGLIRQLGSRWCSLVKDERSCSQCLEKSPGTSVCAKELANHHVQRDDFESAISLLEKTLEQENVDDKQAIEELLHRYKEEFHTRHHQQQQQQHQHQFDTNAKGELEDYYKILEVDPKASAKEIKKSYYKLAKKHHPDLKRTEKEKEEGRKMMAKLTTAHEVLSDPEKRKQYDLTRSGGGGQRMFTGNGGQNFFFAHPGGGSFGGGGINMEHIMQMFAQQQGGGHAGGRAGGNVFMFRQ